MTWFQSKVCLRAIVDSRDSIRREAKTNLSKKSPQRITENTGRVIFKQRVFVKNSVHQARPREMMAV